jgi:hypothetical protein
MKYPFSARLKWFCAMSPCNGNRTQRSSNWICLHPQVSVRQTLHTDTHSLYCSDYQMTNQAQELCDPPLATFRTDPLVYECFPSEMFLHRISQLIRFYSHFLFSGPISLFSSRVISDSKILF